MPRFVLGINYWPRRSAMYMWDRFDLGEIREDMTRIAALGMHIVRFFLTWEAFQPQPDRIDDAMLRRLEAFVQTASDAGLQTMPTLFCGHMSGVNWLPAWTLDRDTPHGRFRTVINGTTTSPFGVGDIYADPALLDAQERFARAAGKRLADHPGVYCWDLGNEFSNIREPRTPSDGAAWSARLSAALHETAHAGVTGGMHGEDFERDRGLRPSSMAKPWTIATMHGYPVYAPFARDRMDPEVVPYYAELMRDFSGKPLLFSEFGNPECGTERTAFACLSEDEMALYCTAVLERLHARGALGALWWCWADYDLRLRDLPPFDRAPHELHFGIVRSDGSEKPVARALAEFARHAPFVQAAPSPQFDESAFYAALPGSLIADYRRYRR